MYKLTVGTGKLFLIFIIRVFENGPREKHGALVMI